MLWRVGILETVNPLVASSNLASGDAMLQKGLIHIGLLCMKEFVPMVRWFIFLFLTFNLYGNDSLDRVDLWIPTETLSEKIYEFLENKSLSPFILPTQNPDKYRFIQPCFEDESSFGVCFELIFKEAKKESHGIFIARRDKKNEHITIELLYLTDETPISMELFYDIIFNPGLAGLNPEIIDLVDEDSFLLHISTQNKEDSDEQIWTFFTTNKWHEIPIVLYPDGTGGNYFLIHRSTK